MSWTALIQLIRHDPTEQTVGGYSIMATVDSDNAAAALDGANKVAELFAEGNLTFFRVRPEASSERDFDTNETRHRGFVRFTTFDVAGGWEDIRGVGIPKLGDAATLGSLAVGAER